MRRFRRIRRRRRGSNRRLIRLRRAHQLYDDEKFAESGAVFEEIASQAENRNHPHSPQLFLQAGRANIMAGNGEKGIGLLVRGLRKMGELGRHRQLIAASARILWVVEVHVEIKQFTNLQHKIDQLLKEYNLDLRPQSPTLEQPKLPTKCPQCGGTVHPDEVEWHMNRTAECEYCGSILEAQL